MANCHCRRRPICGKSISTPLFSPIINWHIMIDVFGPDRIVMGTDYPFDMGPNITQSDTSRGSTAWTRATLAQIAGGNAARVLGLDV